MKKAILSALLIILSLGALKAQVLSSCENVTAFNQASNPDYGIIIYSNDSETVWNALRFANFSQGKGDSVVIFVLGKGVDVFMKDSSKFDIQGLSQKFISNGGNIYTCGTCAKMRGTDEIQSCTITGMGDMYMIIKRSKKVLTF